MKQLPHISGLLYGTPWAIIPETHTELGMLYRSYLSGTLPVPQNLEGQGRISSGLSYQSLPSVGIALIYLEGIISKRTPDMLCGPLNIDLVKNRLRSLQTHFAEEGAYWVKEMKQIEKEEKRFPGLKAALDELEKEKTAA